jgi:hypothetical protein
VVARAPLPGCHGRACSTIGASSRIPFATQPSRPSHGILAQRQPQYAALAKGRQAKTAKIVVDSLNYCHRHKGLRTNTYVIMPTHLHGILFHETWQAKALENVLTDFRKFTGRQIAAIRWWCRTRRGCLYGQ